MSHFAKNREQPKPDLQKHPLGDLVKVFRSSDLSLKPLDLAEISDCQHVASYNWLNDEVPTIVVPGKALLLLQDVTNNRRQTPSVDTTSRSTALEGRRRAVLS